ncbi:hypothetical protein SO802_017141 [Lithocarpus litseifolius]|uniref:Uncharacterized protein n=1 Tax=Lithocarpus litseifolius TaxID=425828 RepID=A0AAW2CYI8_9ROSI
MKRPSLHWYNVCNKLDHQQQQQNAAQGSATREDLDPRVTLHDGIPSTASVLAFDSIQSLLAIGTLIKVTGGDYIEALLISPKQLPFKNLEICLGFGTQANSFYLTMGVQYNCFQCYLWYIGCEFGMVAVLKYDAESKKIIHLPYCVPKNAIADTRHELSDDESDDRELDKEMSSICWASDSGLVLAVGYIDGDIMFWNLPNAASIQDQKAAKSSITMLLSYNYYQAAEDSLSLFCIGRQIDHIMIVGANSLSMAILSLDWSAVIESLKCIGRVDLTLNGFADMVLLPSSGTTESNGTGMSLVVLTNPGKLNVYNDIYLSASISQKEKKPSVTAVEHPMFIPTLDPYMTVAKLCLVYRDGKFSKVVSEIVSAAKLHAAQTPDVGATKWPLTSGIPCQLLDTEVYHESEWYQHCWLAGTNAAVSALDFCSYTLTLAIGNQCGLGESNSIWKVNLVKPCWTATFKKNEKELGLVVLFQSGAIEIR